MIAYDKHQYTNQFLCIAEIDSNNNSISHIIPIAIMLEITFNITFHGSNCIRFTNKIYSIMMLMININAKIIFCALQKLIAITIEFHISYLC